MDKKKKLIFRLVLVLLFTGIALATSNNLSAFRTSFEDYSHIIFLSSSILTYSSLDSGQSIKSFNSVMLLNPNCLRI